jgi:hypothetical protein
MHRHEDRRGDPRTLHWWKTLLPQQEDDNCCDFFRDLGIEWIQRETPSIRTPRYGFHYCPHCGKKIDQ